MVERRHEAIVSRFESLLFDTHKKISLVELKSHFGLFPLLIQSIGSRRIGGFTFLFKFLDIILCVFLQLVKVGGFGRLAER